MKAYLIITGSMFGLLGLWHVWIAFQERGKLITNPGEFAAMLGLGLVAGALSVWAWSLLRRRLRS